MLPYISVFGFELQTYGIFAVLGFGVTAFLAVFLSKMRKDPSEQVLSAMLVSVGGAFLGGHFLFSLTNIKEIARLVSQGKANADSLSPFINGMVFYGGLFGAIAALLIYTKISTASPKSDLFDIFAVSVPLFHAFGRVGCFFAGCCYGIESEFGVAAYLNKSAVHYGVSRFPVQLVEALFNAFIFILLYLLFKKNSAKGKLLMIYLWLYAPVRFVLEFFRGDEVRGFLWGFSTSQIISLLIILFLIIHLSVKIIKKSSK